jgi:hypothetical protein
MKRPRKQRLRRVSNVLVHQRQILQYENAETKGCSAAIHSNGYEVHDQDCSPEASLRGVHDKEGPWLQRIAEEENNGEYVEQETGDNQEHDYYDRSRTVSFFLPSVADELTR